MGTKWSKSARLRFRARLKRRKREGKPLRVSKRQPSWEPANVDVRGSLADYEAEKAKAYNEGRKAGYLNAIQFLLGGLDK
jgi:hypothetical protein